MQTRRDQLQAFRFQNRRALAALVTGEPNVLEPPMRRLTITTISGIMIAVLVTVGFTLFGFFRPKAGDDWKQPGSIIVENETGATYVLLSGKLRPTVNYTSALLAAGTGQQAKVVEVDRSDLGDTPRGSVIGIPGLPVSPPSSGELVSSPVTICSRQQAAAGSDDVTLSVPMSIGRPSTAAVLPESAGVAVVDGTGQTFLLAQGHRYAVRDQRVATALGIQTQPVRVGSALIESVPAGPELREPELPAATGTDSSVTVDNTPAPVGQLLDESDSESFVVMPDGVVPVDRVQRALLLTLQAGGRSLDPRKISRGTAINLTKSTKYRDVLDQQFAGAPATIPAYDRTAGANGGVCAIYREDAKSAMSPTPVFAVPPSQLATASAGGVAVGESAASRSGHADSVTLPAGRAALVRSSGGARTTFLVADSGRRFAAGGGNAGADVLASLGYGDVTPARLPAQVLNLIPTGPAMDPSAARTAVS